MATTRVLTFAASVRAGSYNQRLADYMAARIRQAGAKVTAISLRNYDLPIYDGDLETQQGVPAPAQKLHALLREHDAVFIASPEYNANVTPLLANTLAWVSRIQEHGGMAAAFGRPVYAVGSASPGAFGGYRGLMALRQSLELQLGASVIPTMLAVGHAHQGFDDTGAPAAEAVVQLSTRLVSQLLKAVLSKGFPLPQGNDP